MSSPARDKELVVQDAVVLVRDLLVDDVLILGIGHHHHVVERVVEVAGVVHVDVRRAVVPPGGREVGHARERDVDPGHLPRRDLDRPAVGVELEALHHGEIGLAGRQIHREAPGRVEGREASPSTDPRVGIDGRPGLPVGSDQGHAGRAGSGDPSRPDGHFEGARRLLPAPLRHVQPPARPAVRLEELEPGKPPFIGDEGDPLAVGRPPGVEGVMLEKGHLVRLASLRRLDVEVRVLIARARGRRVDEAAAVQRHVRPGPVERLLRQHDAPALHPA